MIELKVKGEYIKLDQLLKATNLVSTGGEAKIVILEGKVLVNDEVELRRGRKVKAGDMVVFSDEVVKVK